MRKKNNSKWYSPVLFIIILLACLGNTWSQTSVTGKVIDGETNEPLPGVNIIIENSTVGTVTGIDGVYELEVPSDQVTLVFSFIGYLSETIEVAGRSVIDILLVPELQSLDEVVVVGYGTMKRSDLTGSVVSAKSDDLKTLKSNNVLESLQGRMPGVSIQAKSGRTGDGVDISIRGERSLKAGNKPLIILDGIPYGDDIDLNPAEIESVEILKDAASTAIYGAQGANGVILITSKKGEIGEAKVYAHVYQGVSQPTQYIPCLERDGYIKAAEDALRMSLWKDGADWDSTAGQDPYNFLYDVKEQEGYVLGTNTDWQDLLLKQGKQGDYLIGIRGGNENVKFNTSVDYYNEEGVVLNDAFNRITFKANIDAKINKRISAGASTLISHKKREGINISFGHSMDLIPLVSPYDSLGVEQYRPYTSKPRINPSVAAKRDKEELLKTRIFSILYVNINLAEGLDFRSNGGVDLKYESHGEMVPPKDVTESQILTVLEDSTDYNYTVSNVLSYNKDFGKLSANLMAGNEIQFRRYLRMRTEGTGMPFENKLWYSLGDIPQETLKVSSKFEQTTLLSYFYRIGFNYNDLLLLNLSGRHDGASRLAPGHKWAFYPAASGAVRLSNLDFMKDISVISDMKLRLSYGQSGNFSVDPYLTSPLLSNLLYVEYGRPSVVVNENGVPLNNASGAQGYRSSDNLPDASMTWERTTEYNIGLDLGLIDNRIYAYIDAFKTITDGFLLPVTVSLSSGFDNTTKNIGKGETWGIEGLLKTVIINSKDLNWTVHTTLSASKNKLIEIAEGTYEDRSQDWIVGQPYFSHEIRLNTDTWMIYDFDGIWQATPEDSALFNHYNETSATTFCPGEIKVKDKNKDGIINVHDRVLYNDMPKLMGSIESSISYKGLALSFNIYGKYGNTIRATAYNLKPRLYDNMLDMDYWTPDNPTNEWPYVWSDADERGLQNQYILRFTDGSFIKMKHITLSYEVPENLISKAKLSSLEVYGSVKNPFLIYSDLMPGLDPERSGSITFPLSRLFLIGINVEF